MRKPDRKMMRAATFVDGASRVLAAPPWWPNRPNRVAGSGRISSSFVPVSLRKKFFLASATAESWRLRLRLYGIIWSG